MLFGVDVHDGYQAGLSFPLLVKQGYTFATVKFTQGADYVRGQADEWIAAARRSGLIPGAYHWLNGAEGGEQARWFHHNLMQVGGPQGLLIQLDVEDNGYGPQMTAWTREWNRLTDSHPFIIYSGSWWWPRTNGFRGVDLTPYLWHSHYLTSDSDTVPDDPATVVQTIPASWWKPGYGGWDKATFLQFTSRGDAGGLGNNVDLNMTTLTRQGLLALTRSGPSRIEEDSMPFLFWYNKTTDPNQDALYAWAPGAPPQHISRKETGEALKAEWARRGWTWTADTVHLTTEQFLGLTEVEQSPIPAPSADIEQLAAAILRQLAASLTAF